jgi:endonuclease/exonuclease/phosphatase family metal-dependent hydrolase
LNVGTFNIRSATPSYEAWAAAVKKGKTTLELPWGDRRAAVAKQIISEKLDVVGLQEASAGTLNYDFGPEDPKACRQGAKTAKITVKGYWEHGGATRQDWKIQDAYQDSNYIPGYFDELGNWVDGYDELGAYVNGVWTPGAWYAEEWDYDTWHPAYTYTAKCADLRGSYITQFEDLLSRLGKSYADTCPGVRYGGCSGAAVRIFYKPARLQLLRTGAKHLDSKGASEPGARYLVWAEFKDKKSGKKFIFATAHTEPGQEKKTKKLRKKMAAIIGKELAKQNTAGLPVVLTGDFSSTKLTAGGNDVHSVLIGKTYGFKDPTNNTYKSRSLKGNQVKKLINAQYDTLNNFSRTPVKRSAYKLGAHIDYIWYWVKNSKQKVVFWEWENVMNLKKGKIAGTIPSDHNLVRAKISFA